MAIAIRVSNADGPVGQCDSKCYDADTSSRCQCVCGGQNHGVGRIVAMSNAERSTVQWHDKPVAVELHPETRQVILGGPTWANVIR